jgi:hypothetical protein
MWANNEFVSSLGNDPNFKVSISRKNLCAQIHQSKLLDPYYSNPTNIARNLGNLTICSEAYIGHPNKKGAEQYYKQLKKRIELQIKFSLRSHFKAMDPQVISIRKLKEKYSFAPCSSLRRISDVFWIDVISIEYNVSNYAGPSRDYTKSFLSTLYIDFGWGYQMASNQNGLFVLDIMDSKRLSSLKYVKIRLTNFQGMISRISLDFHIKINGYSLPFINLTEKSFQKSGDYEVWGMPTLYFKRENAQ